MYKELQTRSDSARRGVGGPGNMAMANMGSPNLSNLSGGSGGGMGQMVIWHS